MNTNDGYLIMEDSLHLSQYETLFVSGLLVVLFLCIIVAAICEIIEPKHSAYRASMAVHAEERVSEWNNTYPDGQIEIRERNE